MASRLRADVSSAAAAVLTKQSEDICGVDDDELSLRVQLDSMAFTARVTEAISVFNQEQSVVRISLLPTPEPMDVSDIVYGPPTLAANGRWTDFVGHNMEEIAAYLSPNNRRISHYLYYRRDMLKERGLGVPQTWEELIAAVKALNGTDINADGSDEFGICFNADAYCGAPYVFMQIYFSMFVYGDPNSRSWLLDPKTLAPLANNAATKRALAIYAELARYNHPLASVGCQAGSQMFCNGHCAITLNSDQFRQSADQACSVLGNLGTAPPPGSSHVLDYKSNTLVPCTRTLCPHAVPATAESGVLVNHAPLYVPLLSVYNANPSFKGDADTAIAAFSSHIQYYYLAYNDACDMATANGNASAAGNTSAGQYFARTPLVEGSMSFNLDPLIKLGYNANDATEFLQVTYEIEKYGNRMLGTPVPGASYYRTLMGAAAINATRPNANLTQIMETLNAKYNMVVAAFNNTALYLQLFRFGVGYEENPLLLFSVASGRGSNWKQGQIAGVAAAGACVLLLACATVLAIRQYTGKRQRSLLGKLLPPGVGPATTLLVTDIQGSTDLWELVPNDVMERALAVHHGTLQQLLGAHRGYESATEGDSFILAFHSPADALAYAAAAQLALLQADWPPELLQLHASAAPCMARTQPHSVDAMLSGVVRKLQAGALESLGSVKRRPALSRQLSHAVGFAGRLRQLLRLRRLGSPWVVHEMADLQQIETGASDTEHREGSLTITSKEEALHAGQGGRSCSFGWALSQAWTDDEHQDLMATATTLVSHHHSFHHASVPQLIWKGLRVRMGLHSTLTDPAVVSVNATSRRTQYSGTFAATAKSVCDSGHGGQVLLSADTFAQLAGAQRAHLHVLHMGEHVLAADQPPQPLYQAVTPSLEARLQSFPPLRSKQPVNEGVMAAPVGNATVVFMNAGAVQLLLAWDAAVTRRALHIYHDRVQKLLGRFSGYLPELCDGLALAVFQRPEDAVRWALSVQKGLLAAPWPPELLANELCEPVTTTSAIETEGGITIEHQVLALRGLRLKVGIATGEVLDYISPTTARVMYHGRVMNWAARISTLATSGQVLCMEGTWQLMVGGKQPPDGIAAVSAGLHMLKGVKGPVHVHSCTYTASFTSGSSTSRSGTRRTSTISHAVDDSLGSPSPQLAPAVSPSVLEATGSPG